MDFTLILGPMKSGKTLELISRFSPLTYANLKAGLFQPFLNVRDKEMESRSGAKIMAQKIKRLDEILKEYWEVVCIDEIHMFNSEEIEVVGDLLKQGVKVMISGLDMDYRGRLFPTVARLLEFGPQEIIYKRAVCEACRKPNAVYTQIFKDGRAITSGVPSVIPEDGTYLYRPVCRQCFVKTV
ncbi:MAG: thymidine kinase [Candidatus Magasanikbacteria bacterium]|nr:thymidine kinase [Candidatus Magasanikbacteria bacterium]